MARGMNAGFHRSGKVLRLLAASGVLMVAASQVGCLSQLLFLGLLVGGPPTIEPNFETQTGKSMTEKDVTVAVICYAPTELKWDFDEVDHEIAKYVTYRLHEHKIKVVSPDAVRNWLDRNPDWDRPDELGEAVGATYVIYIDLHEYSLYEESAANLYRGRAEALVSVFEMSPDGSGEKIYSKDLTSRYPRAVPRSTSDITYSNFKRQYLSVLSDDIGELFYPTYNGKDMHNAT